MKILMIGDVVADVGCEHLISRLPALRREHDINLVIANGENSADCNGITPYSADKLLSAGVDVITTGNHCFKRREIIDYIEQTPHLLRPANLSYGAGNGLYIYDGGSFQVAVINLLGQSFMEPVGCPFETVDRLLNDIPCSTIIVDFHCEATGENKAMGYYLAGRVSVIVGTHTHIQTADAQILGGHTGYITDVGMTGPMESVLGVDPKCVIERLKTHLPTRFITADSPCQMDCVVFDIDKAGRCIDVKPLQVK